MGSDKIKEWAITAALIEDEFNLRQNETGWKVSYSERLLTERSHLKKLIDLGKPIGILDDISDTGMPPILMIRDVNPFAEMMPWGIRRAFGFVLWKEPEIRIFDLDANPVWEGVLQPSDRDLILKFATHHYVMTLSGQAINGTVFTK